MYTCMKRERLLFKHPLGRWVSIGERQRSQFDDTHFLFFFRSAAHSCEISLLINYSSICWSDPLSNLSSSISLSLPSITSWHCIHRNMLIWRSPWKTIWTELNVWQLTTIRNFPNPPNIQQYHTLNIC